MLLNNQVGNVIFLSDRSAIPARRRRNDNVLDLDQSRLHELFTCDARAGQLFWRQSGKGRRIGRPAGALDTGHRVLRVDGITHPLQRAVWVYVNGPIPGDQRIRFEDGDPLNCGIANLRLARTKKEADALFRARNPDAQRRYNYTKNYQGMTIGAFDSLLASQGGVCAICRNPETNIDNTGTGKLRKMSVDHDHGTNAVRGVLCNTCNRGLGLFSDSADLLRAAAAYLERHAMKKVAA
jgi:hypothetical protein